MKNTQSSKMTLSGQIWKPSTFDENDIKINSDIFKIDYPHGKRLKKITDRKHVSAQRKVFEVFPKIPIEKMRLQFQKFEKYLKSKNDIKKPLRPFNKESWAIYFFFNLAKF